MLPREKDLLNLAYRMEKLIEEFTTIWSGMGEAEQETALGNTMVLSIENLHKAHTDLLDSAEYLGQLGRAW